MTIKKSRAGVTGAAAMLVLALGGCGGGATREARQLSGIGILEKTSPLGRSLVRQSDIDKASDASGVKTLRKFWLALQYQDYESATGFFYPKLADFVGISQLGLALKSEAALWSSTKPDVVEATTTGNTARVIFVVRNLQSNATPVTIAFRKLGTVWEINYFTLLDEALRSWAQQRVQSQYAPTSQQVSKQALAAATQALQIQSEYLQKERTENAPGSGSVPGRVATRGRAARRTGG